MAPPPPPPPAGPSTSSPLPPPPSPAAASPSVVAALVSQDNDDDADFDIEKLLSEEASLLSREQEVERVLKAFKLNPYEILDLTLGRDTTPEMIRESLHL
jgi:DnaJ family protein C protein 8